MNLIGWLAYLAIGALLAWREWDNINNGPEADKYREKFGKLYQESRDEGLPPKAFYGIVAGVFMVTALVWPVMIAHGFITKVRRKS